MEQARGQDGGVCDRATFLAMVSHEIRTPMSAVQGMASLLLDSSLTSAQRHQVLAIRKATDHALTLLDSLLLQADVVEGNPGFSLRQQAFDLPHCIIQSSELFVGRAREKGLGLRCELASELPRLVLGDDRRLSQIVMNLLGNAIKFTEVGSVGLEGGLEIRPAPDGAGFVPWLCLRVWDTGIGIAAEDIPRVFRPYFQATTSKTQHLHAGGTGLGLAISRDLAQRMGGTLDAESEPGRGTVMVLRLPLSPLSSLSSEERMEMEAEPHEAGRPSVPNFPGRRVLLVEDDALNREVVSSMLAACACEVRCAGTGLEALESVFREDFDLLLLDLNMPGMGGGEVAREIRRREEVRKGAGVSGWKRRLPIVVLTASLNADEGGWSPECGVDAVCLKPLDRPSLSAVLKRFCSDKAGFDERPLRDLRQMEKAGRPDLLARVVGLFLEKTERFPAAFLAACREENAGQVQHLAHNLKSASAHVGAMLLSGQAAELEVLAQSEHFRFESAEEWMRIMEELLHQARQAVVDHMEQLRHE